MTEKEKAEAYVRKQRPALVKHYETSGSCTRKELPINLQDWLAVLAKKNTRNVCVDLSQAEGGILYFEDEISHWSFKFNLTTGQPNSPEDYKAFNDIVGI